MRIEEMIIELASRFELHINKIASGQWSIDLHYKYGAYIGTYNGMTLDLALRNAISMMLG